MEHSRGNTFNRQAVLIPTSCRRIGRAGLDIMGEDALPIMLSISTNLYIDELDPNTAYQTS